MANKKKIDETQFVEYTPQTRGMCLAKEDLFSMARNLGEKEVKEVLYGLFLDFVTGEKHNVGTGSKGILFDSMLSKQRRSLKKFRQTEPTREMFRLEQKPQNWVDETVMDDKDLPF